MKPFNPFEVALSGINLIEAGAGTGKTFNIASLYVRSVIEKGLLPSQILVLTFTKASTAELRQRLYVKLKTSLLALQTGQAVEDRFIESYVGLLPNQIQAEERLRRALDAFDEASIYTIHGFCQRVIEEQGFRFGRSTGFEVLEDAGKYVSNHVRDEWRSLNETATANTQSSFLVQLLIHEGFYPTKLSITVQTLMATPYAIQLPGVKSMEAYHSLIEEVISMRQELRVHWAKAAQGLRQAYEEGAFKKNIYNNFFTGHIEKMTEWVDSDSFFTKWKPISLFSQSKINASTKTGFEAPRHHFHELLDSYLKNLKDAQVLAHAYVKSLKTVVEGRVQQNLDKDDVITYDGLLKLVRDGLRTYKPLRGILASKYPIALLDEFQDTDPVQYEIFSGIYKGMPKTALFMIGDPKQAIYSFRGADVFTYLKAREDAVPQNRFSLTTNYRSHSSIVNAVNHMFGSTEQPFVINGIMYEPAGIGIKDADGIGVCSVVPIEVPEKASKARIEEQAARVAAKDIACQLFEEKACKATDIAVLVRENRQALLMQEKLSALGIKSIIKAKTTVFHTKEAFELMLILSAIQNYTSESTLKAALTTRMLGFKATDIMNEQQFLSEIAVFKDLHHSWRNKGIQPVLMSMFNTYGCLKKLANYPNGERLITNVIHISELLQKRETEEYMEPFSLLYWFQEMCYEEEKKEEPLRLESDEDLVQIVTIHNSKGLEYERVFLPFVSQGIRAQKQDAIYRYHNQDMDAEIVFGKPAEPELIRYIQEEIAESVRLFYVAVTRAKQQCSLYWNATQAFLSPLHVLLLNKEELNTHTQTFARSNRATFDVSYLQQKLNTLIDSSEGSIQWRQPAGHLVSHSASQKKDIFQTTKPFTRSDLYDFNKITSYSALTTHASSKLVDLEYDEKEVLPVLVAEEQSEKTMFSFPKGKDAGNCVHNIFEHLSFSDPSGVDLLIQQQLQEYGFEEEWKPVLRDNIEQVLQQELLEGSGLKLASIPESNCIKEMGFYISANEITSRYLNKLIGMPVKGAHEENISGYLKGYIDLLIRHDGKYYIIDYKSNYLGDTYADYASETLENAMTEANYHLQYHLYTLALHRYLSKRKPGYNYEDHFGGVLYLFIRGISSEVPQSGIYFGRPSLELITELDEYFESA